MPRALRAMAVTLFLVGCPSYDRYSPIVGQDGLVPEDRFARYGTEQAQAIAIGRAFGASYTAERPADFARQAEAAAEYAKRMPNVISVVPDPSAHLLTVTFTSGWRKAIVPIEDGVAPDRTAGLPSGAGR